MQTVQWGIIGCGDVTEVKSGPAFNKVPNSKLVAVMRRDAAKAADFASRHHVPKWYDDAYALINDPEVNAIYIATPPGSHEQYALAAIHAGKPVYLEKPMTTTAASAQRIADAVQKANGKLVVAHYRREQPLFKKIQQLMDEGTIGTVRMVRLELYKAALSAADLQQPQQAWRVDPALAGGGLFHDLAPHQLDLVYYFFGKVKQASGISLNQGKMYAADDAVAGHILFENGIVFTGSWCFNAAATTDHCEIIGSTGSIHCSIFGGNTITVIAKGITTSYSFEMLQHVQEPMINKVVQYFRGAAPNPCSAAEGVEVMRLIDAFTN